MYKHECTDELCATKQHVYAGTHAATSAATHTATHVVAHAH